MQGKGSQRLHVGVDLGGTKIQTVVMGGRRVLGSERRRTPQSGADDVIAAMVASIHGAIEGAGAATSQVAGIGVGSPGAIDGEGRVGEARNICGFGGPPAPFGTRLSQAFGGIPVKVDNDVRVALRAEWQRGAGRPYKNLLGVSVGTGVGGALILQGRLRVGHGAAGEIGHTMVKPQGRLCSCGERGHLEAYAGRGCIQAEARRRHDRGHHTSLFKWMRKKGRDRATSGVIARALEHGDKMTKHLLDEAVWALGLGLANAQNLLDVDAHHHRGRAWRPARRAFRGGDPQGHPPPPFRARARAGLSGHRVGRSLRRRRGRHPGRWVSNWRASCRDRPHRVHRASCVPDAGPHQRPVEKRTLRGSRKATLALNPSRSS